MVAVMLVDIIVSSKCNGDSVHQRVWCAKGSLALVKKILIAGGAGLARGAGADHISTKRAMSVVGKAGTAPACLYVVWHSAACYEELILISRALAHIPRAASLCPASAENHR